jgi:hypothetical protein
MAGIGDIQGSPQWQTAIFMIAAAWILVSAARGWGKGLMRQLVGIVALVAAGFLVLHYTGQMSEFLHPHIPALILVPVAAVLIWILSFNSIILIGHLLFKRTRECESPLLRLIYGVGGGIIGLCYGLLFVWCVLVGLKVIGRIAASQVEIQRMKDERSEAFILNLAKFKNSMELGYGRAVLALVDPFPHSFYREIDQYSQIIEDPEALRKLLDYPGFRRIWESPQVVELERDPEIAADIRRGDIVAILANRKVIALFNDPQIQSVFTQGDVEAALTYALRSGK